MELAWEQLAEQKEKCHEKKKENESPWAVKQENTLYYYLKYIMCYLELWKQNITVEHRWLHVSPETTLPKELTLLRMDRKFLDCRLRNSLTIT